MAAHFEIKIEGIEELDRDWNGGFLPRLRSGTAKAVRRAVDAGAATARRLVPVSETPRTGTHLRDVIAGRVLGETSGGNGSYTVEGSIDAPKPYAIFLEGGTRPHVIEGRNGGMLRFVWHGVDTVLRRVHHPGTKATPFMGPAYFATEQRLDMEFERMVEENCEKFNGT